MVVRKPSRETSTTRPCSASFGEKAMEWTTKSSLPQSLRDALENRLHLARRVDIERHDNRRFKFAGKRLNIFLGFVVEIGHREFGAECAEGLGAAPGDRIFVGNADDEAFLAFEKLGFHSGYHHRVPSYCRAETPLVAKRVYIAISGTSAGILSSAPVAATI